MWCSEPAAALLTAPLRPLQLHPKPVLLQLIVVSPLRRTLETAAGVFGTASWEPGTGPPFMMAQAPQAAVMSGHAAITAPRIPIVAFEGCRERLGGILLVQGLLLGRHLRRCSSVLAAGREPRLHEPGPAEHLLTGCSCAAAPADQNDGAQVCLSGQPATKSKLAAIYMT